MTKPLYRKPTIIAAFIITLVVGGQAWAASELPYYCTIDRVEELSSDGIMQETEWAQRLHHDVKAFIYDEALADLRYQGFNISRRMRVAQKGTPDNDAIGLVGGTKIFRISTSKNRMPFVYEDDEILYTGFCVKN